MSSSEQNKTLCQIGSFSPTLVCEAGWQEVNYCYSPTSRTLDDAKSFCQSFSGGDILTIEDEAENDFVMGELV